MKNPGYGHHHNVRAQFEGLILPKIYELNTDSSKVKMANINFNEMLPGQHNIFRKD